ncbi:MAG TPA: hypothetical protein VHO70_12910 [Chitinispirillaceae bacterium]|nr:hypothetical protein [Chitinispirillaceae bacterium]
MAEAAATAILFKSLAYGIPAAILVTAFLVFLTMSRHQKEKTDQDRIEHMNKWNSMIQSQKENFSQLIKSHQEETDRMFRIMERNAQSQEATTHSLTIISRAIEQKTICPFNQRTIS